MGAAFNYSYFNVIGWNRSGTYEAMSDYIFTEQHFKNANQYLLFLKFDSYTSYVIPNLNQLITSLDSIYKDTESPFIILTPHKSPPIYTSTEDEYVYSFSCKLELFEKLRHNLQVDCNVDTNYLLFNLLDVLISEKVDKENIFIRQIPFSISHPRFAFLCDVIIPFTGNAAYLKNTLSLLVHMKGLSIYVGIDQAITEEIKFIIDQYPEVTFYIFEPNPLGPYVIRNRLIERSVNDVVFFHDSDDISCSDRFETIIDYMSINNCELCGSHELRLDYYKKTVQSIRYPLDVHQALNVGPWHALLHPASAISRRSFYFCGKLSEERIFANDTKFLLKCFFHLRKIMNVDEFLYIRRKHPDSLTNREETKLDSPVRKSLLRLWNRDFENIKEGKLDLKNSSLIFVTFDNINVIRKISD